MTGPQVERRNPNPILTDPLPGVRVPTNVPSASIGVPHTLDLSQTERAISEIVQDQRQKADQVAALDQDNQLAKLRTDLHTKALQAKGKNAMGVLEDVDKEWKKGVGEIEKTSVHTDHQRSTFQARVGAQWGALYQAVENHASAEANNYELQTFQDGLSRQQTDAAQNYLTPGALDQAVNNTHWMVDAIAKSQGWADQTRQQVLDENLGRLHLGVLEQMTAKGKDLDATAYLAAHRTEFDQKTLGQATKMVDTSSVLGEACRLTDGIVKTAATPEAAFAAVEALPPTTDARVRERASEKVVQHYTRQAELIRIEEARAFDEFVPKVIAAHSIDVLTPAERSRLSGANLLRLTTAAKRVSDPDTLMPLLHMMSLDPTAFKNYPLENVRDKLSDADFRYLTHGQVGEGRYEVRKGEAAHTRQRKALDKLEASVAGAKTLGFPVPPETQRKIHALRDSLQTKAAPLPPVTVITPKAPGGPLRQAQPKGDIALPKGAPALPFDPVSMNDRHTPRVPQSWIDHADMDSDYADYLENMGVSLG